MSDPPSTLIFRPGVRKVARLELREFAASLVAEVAPGRCFTCLLTGDRELRRLNRQFLGRDYPADVLSFPVVKSKNETGFLGDVAISTTRAAEQARGFGHSVEKEIGILMLHGLLHLLGMDHEFDRGRMARVERRYRERLGLPAGLIERAAIKRGAGA
jgi:probable rRNA maturation factor